MLKIVILGRYDCDKKIYNLWAVLPNTTCCTRTVKTEAIIGSDRVFLDHISLSYNSRIELSFKPGMIDWVLVLNGIGKLDGVAYYLTPDSITYLLLNFF